jgi:hypothetical protein
MNTANQHTHIHPVMYAIKKFFSKLRQNPEIYPIKYYKKGQRFRKSYRSSMGK